MATRYFFVAMVVALASCSRQRALAPSELAAYVNDPANGFTQQKDINGLELSARYEPLPYKVIRDMGSTAITRESYQASEKESGGYYYFIFRIGSESGDRHPFKKIIRSQEDHAKVFRYTQTLMQNDFHLESDGRKTPCALYHMEMNEDVLSYSMVSLAFDTAGITPGKDVTLVYNDQLFECGPVKFSFPSKIFTQSPSIKLP